MQIKKQLNEDFENFCNWSVDNKLSIHFREDKAKSILFTSNWKAKNICQLNIKYKGKYKTAFASNISWMHARRDDVRRANDIINKINSKLKFLYRENRFLSPGR